MSAANTKYVFNNMGYTCSEVSGYSNSLIAQNIMEDKPIWVAGYTAERLEGHAWLIDGCRYTETKYNYYKTYSPYELAGAKLSTGPYYFRCNWGWANTPTSYCLSLSPDAYYEYAYYMEVIYNISPL